MWNDLQDKSVLLTGAAGFLGSHLADAALAHGTRVVGVDNFLTGRAENIAHLQNNEHFLFVDADVSQPAHEYLPDNFSPDLVLHFASPASPPLYQKFPTETYSVNAFGTHHLLDFLLKKNPQARFVFASTSEIYGDPLEHPQSESYWGNVNPNGIRSCYDESKRMGETICGVFNRQHGMDVRIVRIFNTYGPRMDLHDGRVIPNFIKAGLEQTPYPVYGDGSQTRSYCYVGDEVAGILQLATLPNLSGETINIGNDDEYTVQDTAVAVERVIKKNPQLQYNNLSVQEKPLPGDDPTRRRPDISKARQLLDWEPKVGLADGLAKTIEYFLSHDTTVGHGFTG